MSTKMIEFTLGKDSVFQREFDGYINGTQICKAAGKQISDYLRLASTKAFLKEVENQSTRGIPRVDLVDIVMTNTAPKHRGTWVHPDVAIDLALWADRRFTIPVTKMVYAWMEVSKKSQKHEMFNHLRRHALNARQIPPGYFSILQETAVRLFGPLEMRGHTVKYTNMPDISIGMGFANFLRSIGVHDEFNKYWHRFEDGREPVRAFFYPNKLLEAFGTYFTKWLKDNSMKYFKDRDPKALPVIQEELDNIKMLEDKYSHL